MKKPKTVIVPFSEVAKNDMRLDPGFYLGTLEEEDVEKLNAYIKRTLRSTYRRALKVYIAYLKSRFRLFKWRIEGRIRYR